MSIISVTRPELHFIVAWSQQFTASRAGMLSLRISQSVAIASFEFAAIKSCENNSSFSNLLSPSLILKLFYLSQLNVYASLK
jgi:hypothetical protein